MRGFWWGVSALLVVGALLGGLWAMVTPTMQGGPTLMGGAVLLAVLARLAQAESHQIEMVRLEHSLSGEASDGDT